MRFILLSKSLENQVVENSDIELSEHNLQVCEWFHEQFPDSQNW